MTRTRISAITVMVAVALVAWAGSSYALIQKPFQIGFGGGVSVPVSDAADALKSGWHGTAILKFNLPGIPFDLRGLASYQHFALDSKAAGYDGVGKIISGLGNVTYTMPLPGPVKPYITAGLGAFNVKTKYSNAGITSPAAKTKFGIDAGAGIQFGLMGLNGFVEGKFENIYTDQGYNASITQNIKTQVIPVTFGVYF